MKTKNLTVVFKALAHPHRLAIFLRLARCRKKSQCDPATCSRLCVGELGRGLGIGLPTVSHHLKELSRAGLVSTRKVGQNTECWAKPKGLDQLSIFLKRFDV